MGDVPPCQVETIASTLERILLETVESEHGGKVRFSEQLSRHGAYFPVNDERRSRVESLETCGSLAEGSYILSKQMTLVPQQLVDLHQFSTRPAYYSTQFVPMGTNKTVRVGGIALDVQVAVFEMAVAWLYSVDADVCKARRITNVSNDRVDAFIEETATAIASRLSLMCNEGLHADGLSQQCLYSCVEREHSRCKETAFLQARLDAGRLEMLSRVIKGEVEMCHSLCANLVSGFSRRIPEARGDVATLICTISRAHKFESEVMLAFVTTALSDAARRNAHLASMLDQTAKEIGAFEAQRLHPTEAHVTVCDHSRAGETDYHRLSFPGFSGGQGVFYVRDETSTKRHALDDAGMRVACIASVVAFMEARGVFAKGRVSVEVLHTAAMDAVSSAFLACTAIGIDLKRSSMGLPLDSIHRDAVNGDVFTEEISMLAGVSCGVLAEVAKEPYTSELQARCGPSTKRCFEFVCAVINERRRKLRVAPSATCEMKDVLLTIAEVRAWNPIMGKLTIDGSSLKKRNKRAFELLKGVAQTNPGALCFKGGGKTHKKETVEIAPMYLMNLLGQTHTAGTPNVSRGNGCSWTWNSC